MKNCKWMGITVAAAMLAGSLSALPVSAADDILMGDIDNDGYLTGHDTAMLSRHLLDDTYTLTENQLSRADITGDGLIDEADVTWIQVNEEYALGDYEQDGSVTPDDAYYIIVHCRTQTIDEMTPLQFNLADVDANGYISFLDVLGVMEMYTDYFVGGNAFCGEPFCYYYHFDNDSSGYVLGDMDGDKFVTDHDALMAAKASTTTPPEDAMAWQNYMMGDVNGDGVIDQTDSDWIHEHAEYAIGELRKDGSLGDSSAAYEALRIYALDAIDKKINIITPEYYDSYYATNYSPSEITLVDYNLLDANADGVVDMADAQLLLTSSAYVSVGRSYESAYQEVMLS
ncbi:MAG: dockerin type I repeat-containing protein [Ruminococcus sp.]